MRWTPSTRLKLPVVLCSMMLTACETTQTTAMPSGCVPCAALTQVTFSASDDTEQTIQEIREQNAAIAAVCP